MKSFCPVLLGWSLAQPRCRTWVARRTSNQKDAGKKKRISKNPVSLAVASSDNSFGTSARIGARQTDHQVRGSRPQTRDDLSIAEVRNQKRRLSLPYASHRIPR